MVERTSSSANDSENGVADMAELAARSQRIVSEFLSRQKDGVGMADPTLKSARRSSK